MRVLKSDAGVGFPLRMDDLRYMAQGLTEALAATTAALGQLPSEDHGILLRGSLTQQGATLLASDCWVFFQAEVFFVPAQSLVAVNAGYPAWHFIPASVVEQSRLFRDGTVNPVHIRRTLAIASHDGLLDHPVGTLNWRDVRRIADAYVLRTETAWQIANLNPPSAHGAISVCFRRNNLGNVEIAGSFLTTPHATDLFTLPAGFRPTLAHSITLYGIHVGLPEKPIVIDFRTNGSVVVHGDDGVSAGNYFFNHTIFR